MPIENVDTADFRPHNRVMGVGASPRKRGNSDVLLNAVMEGVKNQAVPAEQIQLRDYTYSACIGCERCRRDKICTGLNDGMTLLYAPIIASRALVLVSPTHHYNVTAWMKAFVDRLYCFYKFDNHRPRGWSSRLHAQGRKALIVAVCEQASAQDMGFTLDAMRLPLEALGYEITGSLAVFGVFDRGQVKKQADQLKKAAALGEELALGLLRQ